MAPRPVAAPATQTHPPLHHHHDLTKSLSPSTVADHLSIYLDASQSKPHLHPDGQLRTNGIEFSAHAGPSGGLALHHLRRIAAGLRGDVLVKESEEELRDRFGEADVSFPGASVDVFATRAAKRKRTRDDIEEWSEHASHAGMPDENESPRIQPAQQPSLAPLAGSNGESPTRPGRIGDAATPRTQRVETENPQTVNRDPILAKQLRQEAKKARKLAQRRAKAQAKGGHHG